MDEMIQQCTQMMNGMANMMGSGMMGGMMGNGSWWASPGYWLGWASVLALVALIVMAFVWTVRRASRSAPDTEAPLAILQRRFARGEITPEQHEQMKRQLAEG